VCHALAGAPAPPPPGGRGDRGEGGLVARIIATSPSTSRTTAPVAPAPPPMAPTQGPLTPPSSPPAPFAAPPPTAAHALPPGGGTGRQAGRRRAVVGGGLSLRRMADPRMVHKGSRGGLPDGALAVAQELVQHGDHLLRVERGPAQRPGRGLAHVGVLAVGQAS